MWCFTDYGQNSVLDLHGAVDRFRLPKDIFYFYEAMWASHPVLHILGHWNHKPGSPRQVVVFTNCKDVELTLNGKSLGKGVSCVDEYPAIPNAPLVWNNVAFEAGTLEAAGKFGKQKIADRRKTAGKPAKVAIVASNDLIADGRDISYIDLTICDVDGNRCYTTDSRLSLTVSGPARLGGPKDIAAGAGLARVAIRSTGETGDIKVVAIGQGLSNGELKLKAYRRGHLDSALTLPLVDVCAKDNQLRIMPLGDSITAGYTDNPKWKHPFEFGYRSGLYRRLKNAGHDFIFVGDCREPFDNKFGDPTHRGTVSPKLDLGKLNQDGHRGYGGWGINSIQKNVAGWIKQDRPDIILLLIGINGINANSPQQLDALVKTIYDTDKNVKLIVAQITPLKSFNQNLFDYNTYIRRTLLPTYADKGYAISTIDLYKHFLTDPNDPKSIDPTRLSNRINHPTNALYDKMAQSWFQGIRNFNND